MGEDQRRAVLAVVLSGIILFGWQYFFAPPIEVTTNSSNKLTSTEVTASEKSVETTSKQESAVNTEVNKDLETIILKNEVASYKVDNNLNIAESTSKLSDKKFSDIFTPSNSTILFNFNNVLKKLYFQFEKISDDNYLISNTENKIKGTISLDDKGYLKIDLTSENSFQYTLRVSEKEKSLESGQKMQYALFDKDLELFTVGDEEFGDKKLNWIGLDFNYHLFATVLEKQKNYVFKMSDNGVLEVKSSISSNSVNLKYVYTKKEYDHLIGLGNNLELAVDFGIWSLIAVPILRGLQFFFSVIPNYGISIILLTLIIRMLTFPLQYKSFKSMKKMQDIQPDLNIVREKYKDNPQKMQQETMALFRKAGANPLSGCLPLLLQMPIFFAFYKVLYSAVELVDAPFYFWIKDLSEKDPYYVLPILMAAAMVLQQKLTPSTTADPMQKKLMTFMPLMFAIFMKDLPAGLTLYIFVSTIIGMTQQLFVFKRA